MKASPPQRIATGDSRSVTRFVYDYWEVDDALLIDMFLTGLMKDMHSLSYHVGHNDRRMPYFSVRTANGENVLTVHQDFDENRGTMCVMELPDMKEPFLMPRLDAGLAAAAGFARAILTLDMPPETGDDQENTLTVERNAEGASVACRYVEGTPS